MKKETYDDIIHLPRPVSTTRPRMSAINRAAQFSPFAALSGYEAAIKETARHTQTRVQLDDSVISDLDDKLKILSDEILQRPQVVITFFQPDKKKQGGAYLTVTDYLQKIDRYQSILKLESGREIPIKDILSLQSDCFKTWEEFHPEPAT